MYNPLKIKNPTPSNVQARLGPIFSTSYKSIIPNFWVFAATYKTDTQASSLLMIPKKLVYPALFSQTTKAEREKGKQSLRWQVC